jgi:hypothetical protein
VTLLVKNSDYVIKSKNIIDKQDNTIKDNILNKCEILIFLIFYLAISKSFQLLDIRSIEMTLYCVKIFYNQQS